MIRRVGKNLGLLDGPVPDASIELERDGYTVLRGVLDADEVAALAVHLASEDGRGMTGACPVISNGALMS